MKRKKKKTLKRGIRFLFSFVIFSIVTVVLGYNMFSNIVSIRKLKLQQIELKQQLVNLEKEKEVLETDILKLKNPDYIGKYVREKYFYSKDGELILRIDD